MKKIAGVGNAGAEELSQLKAKLVSRADTSATLDALFASSKKAREGAHTAVQKAVVTSAANSNDMAPVMAKIAAAVENEQEGPNLVAHTEAFFQKLAAGEYQSTAQRRYPELLKAAAPTPNLAKRTVTGAKGTPPAMSPLSGGAA